MRLLNKIDVKVRKHAKVVEILERRTRKHRREYLVRWNGVDESLSCETRYGILNKTMVDDFDKQWNYAEKLKEEQQMDDTHRSLTRDSVIEEQEKDILCQEFLKTLGDEIVLAFIEADANKCMLIEGVIHH